MEKNGLDGCAVEVIIIKFCLFPRSRCLGNLIISLTPDFSSCRETFGKIIIEHINFILMLLLLSLRSYASSLLMIIDQSQQVSCDFIWLKCTSMQNLEHLPQKIAVGTKEAISMQYICMFILLLLHWPTQLIQKDLDCKINQRHNNIDR